MTTRKGRSAWQVCYVVGLWWLLALTAPLAARGDGSISFNGSTSKLQHDTAWLVQGKEVTICAWLYAAGQGEGSEGVAVAVDEDGNRMRLRHNNAAGVLKFVAEWDTQDGEWTFSAADNTWNAVAVTYDGTDDTNDPTTWVNFSKVTATEGQMPDGNHVMSGTGYCIGNVKDQSKTWDGKIAHVQVFDRILSPSELEACLRAPGSVKYGLKLWLPMQSATDVNDRSGNGFNGTATALDTGTNSPVVSQLDLPKGVVMLPIGKTTVTQHVLSRYADGSSPPGAQLRGWGAASIIEGNDLTDNQATPAVIITEGINDTNPGIAEWQVGSIGYSAAMLQPVIENLTVVGHTTDGYAANGYINDSPSSMTSATDLYGGIRAYGMGGVIDNVRFFYIAGTSVEIGRPISQRNGQILQFDRLKWNLSRIAVHRVFRGIYNHAVDSYMRDIEVEAFREYGVRCDSSVQFQNVHTYGGGRTDVEGAGAGLWLTGEQNLGSGIYVENSPIGLRIDGKQNSISGITSHTCGTNNVLITGPGNVLTGVDLRSAPVSVLFSGTSALNNSIVGGSITIKDSGAGIRLGNGDYHNIDDLIISGWQAADNTFAENGIGVDIDDQLNYSSIEVLVSDCSVGIDFSGGIGVNNIVSVRTSSTVTTPVIWPSGETWNTTSNANETNDIRINGKRYYKN